MLVWFSRGAAMVDKIEPRRELWILGVHPGKGRETVISSYLEAGGYICRLERFANLDLASSGRHALEIERSLAPWRLDAERAWEAFRAGKEIGHTAVVLESAPR